MIAEGKDVKLATETSVEWRLVIMETLKEKEWLFINDLIKKLYEQKNMQNLGNTFLLSIRKLIKYKAAMFVVVSSDFTVILDKSSFSSELDEDHIRVYNEKYAYQDFTNPVLSFPMSTSFRDSDFIEDDQMLKHSFYREWLKPSGFRHCGGLFVKVPNQVNVIVSFCRDEANGPLQDRECFILDLFIGHLENIISSIMQPRENNFVDFEKFDAYNNLSKREKEILPYVLKGYSNQELADEFYISVSTAKKHVYSILRKFNLNRRGDLNKYMTYR